MIAILIDGISLGMLLFLIAVGLSITMGLMNFVNLAHGTFAMAGGYAASVAMNRYGLPFAPALAVGFLAGALLGGALEILLIRHLYRAHALEQVLLSIGIVFVSIATATYVFGPVVQPFRMPAALDGRMVIAGIEVGRYRLFLILFGLAVIAALQLLVGRTRFGAMVRAAVDNQRVAGGTGINVQRLFFVTFSFGCGLAGLGGALGLGMLSISPTFALQYIIYVLMVVCCGGAGTIAGPFLAAILFGIVDTAGKYLVPEAGGFLIYLLVLLVLLVRPNGLVPKRGLA